MPISEHLYNLSEKRRKQGNPIHSPEEFKCKVNHSSENIIERLKIGAYQEIFKVLDSDADNKISEGKCNL